VAKRALVGYAGTLSWLISALVAVAPGAATHTADSGGIYVTTLPSGSDVFVDGTYVGRSPVLVGGLARGHHVLTLTKTGWVVQEVDVAVPRASVAVSSTRLAPGPHAYAGDASGSIVLRGAPPGATFLLDGAALSVPAGQSVSLPAGQHRLTVVSSHGRISRLIDVWPDTTTNVVLEARRPGPDAHSAVVAPAEDYLPTNNFTVHGDRVVVHYGGHTVICKLGDNAVTFDGATQVYDAAGEVISGKLYLPLPLLEKLAEDPSK